MSQETNLEQSWPEDSPTELYNEILAEMGHDADQEPEIDLQALADEVYALMLKELKLELQRFGRLGAFSLTEQGEPM